MNTEQLASELGFEIIPEPLPVRQSADTCPIHGFRFISMPRNSKEEYYGLDYKCPWKKCQHGR